jgi:hypothetical protein
LVRFRSYAMFNGIILSVCRAFCSLTFFFGNSPQRVTENETANCYNMFLVSMQYICSTI